jgi:diacylglycerol kinase (ATP)
MIGVGALGIWLGTTPLEWAVLALAAGGVIAAEALNTAIERLADRVSGEREEAIRLVKDVAAGGVLAATLGAVGAGLAILGPPLWRVVGGY